MALTLRGAPTKNLSSELSAASGARSDVCSPTSNAAAIRPTKSPSWLTVRLARRTWSASPERRGQESRHSPANSRAPSRLGHRPAVLAVDPSSPLTGGAILGDRIRMDDIAGEAAFIRSMATRGHSRWARTGGTGSGSPVRRCRLRPGHHRDGGRWPS